tara:strand:- start:82 stop:1653 length:1572 start_codon:yes stop_codon:yes gene_type:complete
MEKLMSLRRFVKQVKKPVQEIKVEPINKVSDFLSEALEYKGENDDQFAVELVAEIDDNIGSIDGEISKDARPGKNTGKRIGVQIVLPDSKRIAFTSMANEVIGKDPDLELKKPSTTRAKKDFLFKHKDMQKDIYVQTRPDGKRGGGAKADPNELMTAALCTLSSIPKIETVEDLDALIEQVKQITKSGKVIGFTSLEVEALEKDYGNLCQAISAAEAVQKNYGGGADKVYLTGKAWDNDVKQFQITKYGMKDYNASDFIIKKGNSFLGVSLKKKESGTTADPTLINKGFSTMIQGSEFDNVRKQLDDAAGEFYVRLVRTAQVLQRRKPKVAVDKDGNPWLDASMIKELGNRGQGINTSNWKKFVQRIPNELINYQLRKSKSFFKPLADVVVKNSDLFGEQLLQLIFKMDLQDLKKLNFDFALVTGIGRQLVKGPVIEKGEYKNVDTMIGALDKLYTSGKVKMILDPRKTQAYEKGSTAAQLFFQLVIGSTPISDITLRYKGNFRAAPNFLATPTKEFKELLKR